VNAYIGSASYHMEVGAMASGSCVRKNTAPFNVQNQTANNLFSSDVVGGRAGG
jgi:hypothetical protein